MGDLTALTALSYILGTGVNTGIKYSTRVLRPDGSVMNNIALWYVNRMPWDSVSVFPRIAFFTASSTAHQKDTMLGLDSRHAVTSGCSSSSFKPISKAPIARNAPVLPP